MQSPVTAKLGRRAFLQSGMLVLAAPPALVGACGTETVKVGLITDLHYADKPPGGSRHYRETTGKLAVAARRFKQVRPNFVVELGDFIDSAKSVEAELGHLTRIDRDFAAIAPKRHYVLGNHCVHTLKKSEFLATVRQKKSWYSFDEGDFHFVVLDSCFRADGTPYERGNFQWTDPNIPNEELEWLRADLKATTRRTIVFAHQRLDVKPKYHVRNAAAVRQVLEQSERVLAVFQGHSHKNEYQEINGIHYCTLVAMVEGSGAMNNAFSVLTARSDGVLKLEGFIRQKHYQWPG